MDLLRNFFAAEPTNLYWFSILLLILVTSLAVVVLPNIHQQRNHNGWRLLNEFLVRHQFGYVGYVIAILISGYFVPEERYRMVLYGALLVLAFICYGVGLKLASADYVERIFKNDHECDPKAECSKRVTCKLRLIGFTFGAFMVTLLWATAIAFSLRSQAPSAPQTNGPSPASREPVRDAATTVGIVAVRGINDILRNFPVFVHDHLAKLQEESINVPLDSVPIVIESEPLSRYHPFRWTVLLVDDYKEYFALSFRAVYLVRGKDSEAFFRSLQWNGDGPPYQSITVLVPPAEKGDTILIVGRIYSQRSGYTVLKNTGLI